MARYRVRGITVATAATVDHAIAAVWNPSGTKRIYLVEFSAFAIAAPAAASGYYLRRITARGTPGSTATPGAPNSDQNDAAPDSGFLLDLATYTVQPTPAAAPGMMPGFVSAAVIASGILYVIQGQLWIPPGAGVALLNRAAIIVPAHEIGACVDD